MTTKQRCTCGAVAEGWPGEGDKELCQECWEAQCSREWWEMHQAIARVLHPETFPQGKDGAR